MTSTSQKKKADETATLEVDTTVESTDSEPRVVPLDELAKQRQKTRDVRDEAREALARVAQLEAELARLKDSKDTAAPAQEPGLDEIRRDLQEIKKMTRLDTLVGELGLASREQAAVVAKILESSADLTPAEALDIAAKRDPERFKGRGQPGFDSSIHGSMRPSAGSPIPGQQQQSDLSKRFAFHDKLSVNRQRASIRHNAIGAEAAKALGWGDHKLLSIPD